jgi:hypothetical protein
MFWIATSVALLTPYWSVRADVNSPVLLRSFIPQVAKAVIIPPTAMRKTRANMRTAPFSFRAPSRGAPVLRRSPRRPHFLSRQPLLLSRSNRPAVSFSHLCNLATQTALNCCIGLEYSHCAVPISRSTFRIVHSVRLRTEMRCR